MGINKMFLQVNEFFLNNPNAGAGAAARNQTIQDIENRIQWLENNQQKVADWLNTYIDQIQSVMNLCA